MKNLHTALEAITVANGYANTLTAVERTLQRGQSTQPPMAYLLEGDDDVISEAPLGYLSRQLQVGIVLLVQQDEDLDARSASEVMNSLIADVQKKIQEDERRNDLAVLTEETGASPVQIEEGQPVLSCTVAYRIHYRHSRIDPAQVG
jgi:hypothetical protein